MRERRAAVHTADTHRGHAGVVRLLLLTLCAASALVAWAATSASAEEEVRDPRVVGGTAVPSGKYPFMASVQDERVQKSSRRGHFCGGTLISTRHVLTAGHCAKYVRDNVPLNRLRVVVGTTVLPSDRGQARGVSKATIHPRYKNRTYSHDAAVLTLGRPVVGIRPISLLPSGAAGDAYERPGRQTTVAGWGNTIRQGPGFGQPNSFPDRMREARLPLVSDRGCRSSIDRDFGRGFFVAEVEVCAGRTGVDTCQGDSGGPMFVRTATGRFVQVGITSYGNGCGARGNPGVYAEVNSPPIRNFILGAIDGA